LNNRGSIKEEKQPLGCFFSFSSLGREVDPPLAEAQEGEQA